MKTYYIIIALAVMFVIAVWLVFSSSSITVSAVPFGLPAGSRISIGEKAKFPSMPSAAATELRRANDLRMAGALSAAQDNYETILLKYPNLPAALFGAAYSILAQDSISAEKIAKAKNLIESLALKMPGSVWVQLLLTFSREHEGNLNYAFDMAAGLAAKSPAFSEARLRYADLLLKTEQATKAINEAKAAISISAGSDARAYVNLAFALHKIGNLEECSELVNYALPRFPSQTELLLLHGYLSEYARDFDKAQSSYRKILALKPGDANALNALFTLGEKTPPAAGISTVSQGSTVSLKDQAREAAKIILPLIEEYPENLPLREALGKIYLNARLMKEARVQFSEIYSQDFDYPNIKKLMEESSEELPKPMTVIPMPTQHLADSLSKAFATLRGSDKLDYDDLGRYLVHYGSTFKEFFSKYSITRFKRLDEKTFSERYGIGSFFYENTVFFDSKRKFHAVRSIITDSTYVDAFDYIPDLFGHFLRKETGILGDGNLAETMDCGDDKWNSVVWTSRDNFEVLMQSSRETRKVYILRLHSKRFTDTGNPCVYVNMVLGRTKIPG